MHGVGDVCSMNKEWTEVFDTVLAVSLLEHVYDPFKAAAELHRVLKPGGLLFGGVPFIFPYHASPGHYKDYWRFSEDGIEELLTKFDSVDIFAKRSMGNTASKFMPKRISWLAKPLLNLLDKKASKFQVSYYYSLAKKTMIPSCRMAKLRRVRLLLAGFGFVFHFNHGYH